MSTRVTNYGSLEDVDYQPAPLDQGTKKRRWNVPLIIFILVVVLGFFYFSPASSGRYSGDTSTTPGKTGVKVNTYNSSDDSLCAKNVGCASLEGHCCPTDEGLMLGCCDGDKSSGNRTENTDVASGNSTDSGNATLDDSLCAANPGCALYGTSGYCCPTTDDEMLHCCGESGITGGNSSTTSADSDAGSSNSTATVAVGGNSTNTTVESDPQSIGSTSVPTATGNSSKVTEAVKAQVYESSSSSTAAPSESTAAPKKSTFVSNETFAPASDFYHG